MGPVAAGLDSELAFQQGASRFLILFDTALRQAQLYEPGNQVLKDPLQRLARMLEDLLGNNPTLAVRGREESVVVNERRIRCDGPTFLKHKQFLQLLKLRKVEGIVFHAPLKAGELSALLNALARFDRESSSPFEDLLERLREKGLQGKVELLRVDARPTLKGVMGVKVDRRSFAVRTYAKAMVLLRLFLEHLQDPARSGQHHLKLQRGVQDLVVVCLEHGWKYFGLVNNKHFDEYLFNHSANVAILSLVMGVKMRLRRARLVELGMAAILHDIGKALLPKELLEKPAPFTGEDRTSLEEHQVLGVKALLTVGRFNEALLKQILVICEHHRSKGDHHPYSKIIAVAEAFDALTSNRPYRPAYLPDEAVKVLVSMAGSRLDRPLVSAFVQTVGLYPAGTLLELSTGERAIAFHAHPDPLQWRSPIVRIIRQSAGNETARSELVNLAEGSGEGSPSRRVVRTLDPVQAGINVSGCLVADASLSA